MKMIMKIQDIFEIPEKGVVLGGVNPTFDSLSYDEITERIGKQIEIRNPNGNIEKASVSSVEVSESLIGNKNIFILLSKTISKSLIENGAIICS